MNKNSVDKLLQIANSTYVEKLTVSPTIKNVCTCPENCAGCCPSFSLDYWGERWETFKATYPNLVSRFTSYKSDSGFEVWSDKQEDNKGHWCKYVDKKGRCMIHLCNPISCLMEPFKLFRMRDKLYIMVRPFGRGWAMKTVDGGKGAKCVFSKTENYSKRDYHIYLLQELQKLADGFRYRHKLPEIIEMLKKEA